MRPRHIYVHVPFCSRRCSYCDFSIAVRKSVPVGDFVRGLRGELALRFPGDEPWPVDTLYLGGGTPSRLGGAGVAAAIDAIRERISLAPDGEVTIEANPEDISAESVAGWRAAGVNRLSIGSQSFDDDVLRWMHRSHDAAAIARSVNTARSGGIENVSLDLIFALPESVPRDWAADVNRALELEPSHVSLYGLTVEPHTPLGKQTARGELATPEDHRYEAEFLFAHQAMTSAGFDHYEVSNFGRPGRWSRHNSSYWTGAAYAGLGPSAHEFDGSTRRWNRAPYAEWLQLVDQRTDPIADQELLTPENRVAEAVYLGLRTSGGLSVNPSDLGRVQPWIDAGWAARNETGALVLTALGWLRLDALATDLTVVRSRY
ncbi:MAG: radical SAM family heme chaperone HemW [Gemmatimonadaceae bacterium]